MRSLLVAVLLIALVPFKTCTADLCEPGLSGRGRAATLCATPYCTCNQPYGRVQCSCLPHNSSIPQVYEISVKSSGSCIVPPETTDLFISDCRNVTFTQNGIEQLRSLRSINVNNVREVIIEKHAFHWNATINGLIVFLTNTTVANFPSFAFSGRISKIVFREVYLGLLRSYAFSSITDTDRIQFVDCNFANMEPQVFKKFATNSFLIENSNFHNIPSRFLQEVHVHKLFRMDGNIIDVAKTLAFNVNHPTETIISNNRIHSVNSEVWSMFTRGPVVIRDNVFESIDPAAFRGISTDKRQPFPITPDLRFENNTLGIFQESSFLFNNVDFNVLISKMRIDETCSCDNLLYWRDILFPNKKQIPMLAGAHLSDVYCHENSGKEVDFDYVSGATFYETHCTMLISSIYFFVIIIVTTAVGLCVLIVVCICILRRRRQWDMVPTTEVNGVTPQPPNPQKGLVLPEGRVYRETEFHVIVEKAEPLDEAAVPYRVTRDRSKTMFTREPL